MAMPIKMVIPAILAVMLAAGVQARTKVQIPQGESVLTLRVDGDVTIDPEGKVLAYQLLTELDPQIEKLITRAVPAWRFKPILRGGSGVSANSPMRITLAAKETNGGYEVRVDNVVFRAITKANSEAELTSEKMTGGMAHASGESAPKASITADTLLPPLYPDGLGRAGVEGLVLLNMRLKPDGTVAEVFASQSSLFNLKGKPVLLDRARTVLEKSAVMAARQWRFKVEAREPSALKASDLTVRVPVEYILHGGQMTGSLAGKWRHEYRGPNSRVPWLLEEELQRVGVSDLDGGEILAGTSDFRLADSRVIGAAL